MHNKNNFLWLILLLVPLIAGCDQLSELLELPNPKKEAERAEAEGRAIGSACRYSGRSLEDCYLLNPGAGKAAVFAGWRDMNDYMMEHKMEVVPSHMQPQSDGGEKPIAPVTAPPPQ